MTGVTGGFTNIGNLIGGTGTDSYTLSGGTLSGSIDGGLTGVNTLTADNVANTWTITGTDAGTVTGIRAASAISPISPAAPAPTASRSGGGSLSGRSTAVGQRHAGLLELRDGGIGEPDGSGSRERVGGGGPDRVCGW